MQKPVSSRKSVSKLVGIWTFLLLFLLKGAFPKPALALVEPTPTAPVPALSSLGACFRDPKCAAVLLLGGGTTAAATVHYFDEAHKQQMQDKARQKYCLVYPTDWVCSGQMPGVKYRIIADFYYEYPTRDSLNNRWITVFKPATIHFDSNNNSGPYQPIGPINAIHFKTTLQPQYGNIYQDTYDPKPASNYLCNLTVSWGNPPRVQEYTPFGSWVRPGQPPKMINLQVFPADGRPDTGGSFPWLSWSQEKQEQALELLNQPDFLDVTKTMPPGIGLNPGDKVNDEQIIIPGQPKDDPNTNEDESKTRVVPGPLTIPGTPPPPPPPPSIFPSPQPLPTSSPSPSPSPSPTPAPSPQPDPLPSPTTQPPTASGEPPSPSPDPAPSPQPSAASGESPDQPSNSNTPDSTTSKPSDETSQEQSNAPKPPEGPKPDLSELSAAEWRYQRYRYEQYRAGKQEEEILSFEAWRERYFEPALQGGRPGRPGGPAQVATREKLADEEGFINTENITLGERDGKQNFVDMYKPNEFGGTDYVEVDDILQKGIPRAAMREKLKSEISELGPNDRLIYVDKVDPSRRITYGPKDDPSIVDSKTVTDSNTQGTQPNTGS